MADLPRTGAKCRSCGASILFVRSMLSRKWMILDETIALATRIEADPSLTYQDVLRDLGKEQVVSHFATCTEPERWRRPK